MIQFPSIPGIQIEKKIGSGGMADVYLGTQDKLDRKVAIKILKPDVKDQKRSAGRFLKEAETAAKLIHPNILTIYDVKEYHDISYLVMEYLPSSLSAKIKSRADHCLGPRETLNILKQITFALRYAHKQGVIHRDIKTDNIMFRENGTPVLVDFGIAQAMNSDNRLTVPGMILGTPYYMSPEQCQGEKLDGRSDIYSLGIVLFEMLTGRVPYYAENTTGVLIKHVQAKIPRLKPPLDNFQPLINKMLAKKPADRFGSEKDIIKCIEMLQKGKKIDLKAIESKTLDEMEVPAELKPKPLVKKHHEKFHMETPIKVSGRFRYILLYLFTFVCITGIIYLVFFHENRPGQKESAARMDNQQIPSHSVTREGIYSNPDIGKKYHDLAKDNYINNEFEKALTYIRKARELSDSAELVGFENKILQKLEEEKISRLLEKAQINLEAGEYLTARENILSAKKIKETPEIIELETKIAYKIKEKEKEEERQKELAREEKRAFEKAMGTPSVKSLSNYLKAYPTGRYATEVKEKINQLELAISRARDDRAFKSAVSKNTLEAYNHYLSKYPRGIHLKECQRRIRTVKNRIIKKTVKRLGIQKILFFQSDSKKTRTGNKVYKTRFSRDETRYIFVEIEFNNKLYKIETLRTPVLLKFSSQENNFYKQIRGVISQKKSAVTLIYRQGIGWSDDKLWKSGNYRVDIFVNKVFIQSATFEIYE